jgi:hypothetical protein
MDGILTVILIIVFMLLGLGIWQLHLLFQIKKRASESSNFDEAKYFELKYQLQYVISIFPVVLAILSVIGYQQTTSIKRQFDSLATSYNSLDSLRNKIKGGLNESDDSLHKYEKDIFSLKASINTINAKDIIRERIYIVPNLIFNLGEYTGEWERFNFRNMVTISGEKLPIFTKPPLIFCFNDKGFATGICGLTTDGFELSITEKVGVENKACAFMPNTHVNLSLMILEQ